MHFSKLPFHNTHTHTHARTPYTHSATTHRSAEEHRQVCSLQARLPVNVGRVLKAAAAWPTAPSGAENQDNFIVITSLLLFPSLSREEEEEKKEGQHEGEVRAGGGWGRNKSTEIMFVSRLAGCNGRSCEDTSVLLFDLLLWRLCQFSPDSQSDIWPLHLPSFLSFQKSCSS